MLATLRYALLLFIALVAFQSQATSAATTPGRPNDGKTPLKAPSGKLPSQTDLFCSKFTATCFDVCLKGKRSGHIAVKYKCGRRTAAASTLGSFDFRCRCPQDVTNTVLKRIGAGTTSISTLFLPTTLTLGTATSSTPSLVTSFTTEAAEAVETASRTLFLTKLETAVSEATAIQSSLTSTTSTSTSVESTSTTTTTPSLSLTTQTSRFSTTLSTVILSSPTRTSTTTTPRTLVTSTFQTTRTLPTQVTSTLWIDEASTQVLTSTMVVPEISTIYKDVTTTLVNVETIVVPSTLTLATSTATSRVPFTTTKTVFTSTSYSIGPAPTTVPVGLAIIDESKTNSRRGLLANSKSTFCTAYSAACVRQCTRVKSTVGIQVCRRKASLSPARQQYLMACRCRNGFLETQHALLDAGNDVHVSVVTVLSTSTVESYTTTVTVPQYSTTLQTITATSSTRTVEPEQAETVFLATLTTTRTTVVATSTPQSTITIPATAYSTYTSVIVEPSPTVSTILTTLTEEFQTTTTYQPTETYIITTVATDTTSELSETLTTSTLTLQELATSTHLTTTTTGLVVIASSTTTQDSSHTETSLSTTYTTSPVPTTYTTTATVSEAIATTTVYERTVTVLAPTAKVQVFRESGNGAMGYMGPAPLPAGSRPGRFYPFLGYGQAKAAVPAYMLTTPDPDSGRYSLQRADGSGLTQVAEVFDQNPVGRTRLEQATFGNNANVAWLMDVATAQSSTNSPQGSGEYYGYPYETYFWVAKVVNGRIQIRPQWTNPNGADTPTVLMTRPQEGGTLKELCIGGSVAKVNSYFNLGPGAALKAEAVYYSFDFS